MFSKKLRALAFFLMSLMVFYVMPVNFVQDVVSAFSSDESENITDKKFDGGRFSVSLRRINIFNIDMVR